MRSRQGNSHDGPGTARGFSLIELMVTIGIFFFLAIAGVPLTMAWVKSIHQRSTANAVSEALARAKALAIRNPQGITDPSQAVAAACLLKGQLTVTRVTGDAPCTQAKTVWTATLNKDASVVIAGKTQAFRCTAYDDRGFPLSASNSASASTCSDSALDVDISSEDPLHVDLP